LLFAATKIEPVEKIVLLDSPPIHLLLRMGEDEKTSLHNTLLIDVRKCTYLRPAS
jgi:hypothetical protein